MISITSLARTIAIAVLAAGLSTAAAAQHGGHLGGPGAGPGGPLFQVLSALGGKVIEINRAALQTYDALPRQGTCAERRSHWVAVLPDAVRYAHYASEVYTRDNESRMHKDGQTVLQLGADDVAFYDPSGKRYAEAHFDRAQRQATIVFRGTRPGIGSDLATDIMNLVGVESGYYEWASALVARIAREHPDFRIVTTGHSLGGGLAIFAVMRNPGTRAFVFNPSGLSEASWRAAGAAERSRVNEATTVIATRGPIAIEPATALSLAGRSILPGHVFMVRATALRPARLHTMAVVASALESVAAQQADGATCDGDLGVIVQ